MPCPRCGNPETIVIRQNNHHPRVRWVEGTGWRLHECQKCRHKFASIQRAASIEELEDVVEFLTA